ncbi:MAG: PQQ-binding-like beta-propeller repeat protein [Planctomycetales bacterium]|nr:PQQ-binding-like beta-propeller repeat protein [Planctomycetales bacterium]
MLGVFLLAIAGVFGVVDADDNWPRFRGPNGAGASDATTIPTTWTDQDFNWTASLPGVGHSSPIVWGERVFVTSADEAKSMRHLLALDAGSGKELWRKSFPFTRYKKHGNNSFATNTPCCDAQAVYVLWQSPEEGCSLWAIDHDGKEIWNLDLGAFKGGHGPGVSPIVYEDMVIVANDQDGASSLLAFDARTGAKCWETARDCKRTSYSTPCVFRPAGRPPELIFTEMHHGVTGVDPQTGKVNWEISVFGTFQQRAIASPVVADDLVIGSSGFTTAEKNVVAVRPSVDGQGRVAAHEVYRLSKTVPHIPTPIVYNGRLFLWTDRGGVVTCADVATGKEIWQKRIGGNFSGSPVCVDGKLYCVDDDGTVFVVSASDNYELIGKHALGDPTRATPAVAGGRMFIRTESRLYSLGGK